MNLKTEIIFMFVFVVFTLIFIFTGFEIMFFELDNVLFEFLLKTTWIFVVVVFYLTYHKIYDEFRKGKKGLNIFKKYDSINEVNMFLTDIENIKGYKKLIKEKNGFILINEAGVFEVRFIYFRGVVEGDIKDLNWKAKNGEIKNPFILKEEKLFQYLVLTKNMLSKIKNVRLVTKTRLVFVLEKHLNKKIYTKEDIDRIYNNIRGKYYGDNED